MKRPTLYDDGVRALAAQLLLESLKKSCPDALDQSTDDDTLRDLKEALDHGLDDDGYALARRLDDQGWDCDAHIVDALDIGALWTARDQLTEKWIGWHGIKPKLAEGATVQVRREGAGSTDGDVATGEIIRIDPKGGTYTVCVPAWGHKTPGSKGDGTIGIVLNWEDVENNPVVPA